MDGYTRKQVKDMTGVSIEALRHYDDIGLLQPQRSGSFSANNRRLYSDEDLNRLGRIVVLREFGLSLGEIGKTLDGEVELTDVLEEKIAELKRQQTHLRNIILFAKYVKIVGGDFFDGMLDGPVDIDFWADAVRDRFSYQQGLERVRNLPLGESEELDDFLEEVITEFAETDEDAGFTAVERLMYRMFAWWDEHVGSVEDLGFFGMWAVFEDDSALGERIEEIGGTGIAAFLQMNGFYVWLKLLSADCMDLVNEIASSAHEDVVVASDAACALIVKMSESAGVELPLAEPEDEESASSGDAGLSDDGEEVTVMIPVAAIGLTIDLLSYLREMVCDEELADYLMLDESVRQGAKALGEAEKFIAFVFGDEGEEGDAD